MQCTVCTSSCRLSKCSTSYYRISWKFCWGNFVEPHYLAQHSPTTIYLGHLDELHYVSTAAVTCGCYALENQHSTYMRSTEQDVLFQQPQNSSLKSLGKPDAYWKRVKISESLKSCKCQLTSCEKNQNTECQSEYNKGMRPGWPARFSLTQMRVRDVLFGWKLEKGRKTARRTGPFRRTWFRMVVYFWLKLNLNRSAKNCFENKIRIWNHQGCAAAAPCPRRPAFIFGWETSFLRFNFEIKTVTIICLFVFDFLCCIEIC